MKKKITLVRVGVGKEDTYIPSPADLEYWRACFVGHPKNIDPQKMQEHGVKVESFEVEEDSLICVKVGGNGYTPSKKDLEEWRQVFEEAQGDPDFKIFTHAGVEIKRLKINRGAIVITSDEAVVVGDEEC